MQSNSNQVSTLTTASNSVKSDEIYIDDEGQEGSGDHDGNVRNNLTDVCSGV